MPEEAVRQGHCRAVTFVWLVHDVVGRYGWLYDQAVYSILSFAHQHWQSTWPAGMEVLVCTDDPSRFELFRPHVSVRPLPRERILGSFGRHRYVHRLKTEILVELSTQVPGALVFIDGDTLFRGPILEHVKWLRPGRMLVHRVEAAIRDVAQREPVLSARLKTLDRAYFGMRSDAMMVNSGVIGLDSPDFEIFQRTLQYIDAGYGPEQPHYWEQLALSLSMPAGMITRATDDAIVHYWDQREEYTNAIQPKLAVIRSSTKSFGEAIDYVRQSPVNVPAYRRPGIPVRVWRKLTGQSRMVSRRIQDDVSAL